MKLIAIRFRCGCQKKLPCCHPTSSPWQLEELFWLVVYLPLWKNEFVSWDDDIPNWMESHKIHVPNHQPDYILLAHIYPLANVNKNLRKITMLLINRKINYNMAIFNSFLYVYQRVTSLHFVSRLSRLRWNISELCACPGNWERKWPSTSTTGHRTTYFLRRRFTGYALFARLFPGLLTGE